MKSFAKLTVAAATLGVSLVAARPANAAMVVSDTRTSGATWDKLDFFIQSISDATSINGLEGTFSAAGTGAMLSVPGPDTGTRTSPAYTTYITNSQQPVGGDLTVSGQPTSYVDFESLATSTVPPDPARTPTGSFTPTSLFGTWFTTTFPLTPASNNSDTTQGNFLAEVYVSHGADVNFSGTYSKSTGGSVPVTFTSATAVPEPASLGLVAAGVGAVVLRRRRASL